MFGNGLFTFFSVFDLKDRFDMNDFEVEEEIRPDYPCPYCYEEFDIASLCSHLEADHSSESRATVSSPVLIHVCVYILVFLLHLSMFPY